MGPWNEQQQQKRAEALYEALSNPTLPDDMYNILAVKLRNLAFTEEEYNLRVVETYQSKTRVFS